MYTFSTNENNTDGSVVLDLQDEEGNQLVASNILTGQTTQTTQRIAPIAQGQTLYAVDLDGHITGPDPATVRC